LNPYNSPMVGCSETEVITNRKVIVLSEMRTTMEKIQSFNEWFTGLEEGRQKVLREDKWMLAENAYNVMRVQLENEKALLLAELKTAYKELEQHSYDEDNFNRVVDFSDVRFEFKKFIKIDTEL